MNNQTSAPSVSSPEPKSTTASIAVILVVVVLLALFATQTGVELWRESCTADEVIHLPAGYSYLLTRDFRLNPEHPPLVKILCAIPLLWLHPKMDFTDPNWNFPPHQEAFGYDFLYSNDANRLLLWGRWPTVLLGIGLGYLIFRWAQQLYGNTAGLFALGLFAFSPSFLAHSHYVTTDVGVCAFLTACFYCLWRHLRRGDRRSFYWAAVWMGLALASKYSALVFFPVALALLWLFGGAASTAQRSDVVSPAHVRESMFRDSRSKGIAVLIFTAIAFVLVQMSYLGSLNPSIYFKGLMQVNKNIPADALRYLHGHLKAGGWWYYFLVVFLVKATVPFLLLVLSRLIYVTRRWREELSAVAFLVLPVAVYFVAVSAWANQFGVRYLLPVFPFLMVFSSGAFKQVVRKPVDALVLWLLLCWHIVSSVAVFPNHLAYFNELVGGPSHGMDWLDDSNVDWGQELKNAKLFLDRRGINSVTIYTFSIFDNPSYYGIHGVRPNSKEWTAIVTSPRPAPGVYVVSAHWLAIMKAIGIDWMKKYPVIGNLGYSMYVFRVP